MGGRLACQLLVPLLPGCLGAELPPAYEIPICRYSYDAANGGLAPHVHEDSDTDPKWWLQPKCPSGAQCTKEFALLPEPVEPGKEDATLHGLCDVTRVSPKKVASSQMMMKYLATDEPFIISDLPAPGASSSSSSSKASQRKSANNPWAPKWPSSVALETLKEALGPRRLVAPQCTVINGTSFSNYRGVSGAKEGLLSSTCEMAWENALDGIFLEKPLPVATRYMEAEGKDDSYFDGDQNSGEEAIIRRPVKLQKRVQFKDISQLVHTVLSGIPLHVWGGWNFANLNASLLFMGSRDTRTPLHKDGFNSLVIQLNGTKHWTLIPGSEQAKAKKPLQELMGSPDDARYRRGPLVLRDPQRSTLKARSCVLRPFEIMYLPGNYWHDVYSITAGASLSVRFIEEFEQILSQAKLMQSQ